MREQAEQLHQLARLKNAHQVQKYLTENPREDLQHIRDHEDNNLVHLACSWGKATLLMMFLRHQRDVLMVKNNKNEEATRKKLEAWINEENKEGFTPIHYASYENDLEMVRMLEDLHANVLATSKTGLNVLHMAAQADALDSAIHFRNAVDINGADDKGMTPLHWAAYLSSEDVAALLISLGCQLNIQNKDQETPLHLAARYGNTRVLRRLLMHGADRRIRNAKGEIALNISEANEFKNISRMLNDDYNCFDQLRFYFNVQMKYSPQDRSLAMPFLFLFSTVLVIGSTHALLQIVIDALPEEYYLLVPLGVFYICFYASYFALLTSPKGLPKGTRYDDLISKDEVCTDCICEKEPRSYHCEICKLCIRRYDHHCPWINGCVGQNNLKRFILFLFLLVLALAENGVLSAFGLFSLWTKWRFEMSPALELVAKIVLGIDLALCIIFIVPLLSLVWVQLTNICVNRTTFERFSKAKKKAVPKEQPANMTSSDVTEPLNRPDSRTSSVLSKEQEPEQQPESCSCANCAIMCSDNSLMTKPTISQITDHV